MRSSAQVSWPRAVKEIPIPSISPQVSEGLIQERVNTAIRRNAGLVRAGEEATSARQRFFDRFPHAPRVVPRCICVLPFLRRTPHQAPPRQACPSIRVTDTTGTVVVPAPAPAKTRSTPPDSAPA